MTSLAWEGCEESVCCTRGSFYFDVREYFPWNVCPKSLSNLEVNNIINAISIGLASGVTLNMCLANAHLGSFSSAVHAEDVSHSLQDLTVSMILCSVGPFLYQALLEVAVCIAQPFASSGKGIAPGRIPTEKLLFHLEKDLRDIEFMSSNLPAWEQAYFKPKN